MQRWYQRRIDTAALDLTGLLSIVVGLVHAPLTRSLWRLCMFAKLQGEIVWDEERPGTATRRLNLRLCAASKFRLPRDVHKSTLGLLI